MRRFLFRRLPLRWRHRAYARAAMRLRHDQRAFYLRRLIERTPPLLHLYSELLAEKMDWLNSNPRLRGGIRVWWCAQ